MMVTLRGEGTTFARDDVYFPFASGSLSYDCKVCGSECCKGHGFVLGGPDELRIQLSMRRSLPLFIEKAGSSTNPRLAMNTCRTGCFMLRADGACSVHAEHGHALKPETCRLFPFNSMKQAGKLLIVAPHQELCPLQVQDVSDPSDHSDHHMLFEEMSRGGISGGLPRCTLSEGEAMKRVQFERRVIALTAASAGTSYLNFVDELLRLEGTSVSTESEVVSTVVETSAILLGSPSITELGSKQVASQISMAVTPIIRARLLFPVAESPQPSLRLPFSRKEAALTVLMLYLFAESSLNSGAATVSYQSITTLFNNFAGLARLIGLASDVVSWTPDAPIINTGIADQEFKRRFSTLGRALLPQIQSTERKPLGQLLVEHSPRDPIRRVLFLKEIAPHLYGFVGTPDRIPPRARSGGIKTRIQQRVHRWALSKLSPDAVPG